IPVVDHYRDHHYRDPEPSLATPGADVGARTVERLEQRHRPVRGGRWIRRRLRRIWWRRRWRWRIRRIRRRQQRRGRRLGGLVTSLLVLLGSRFQWGAGGARACG